MSNATKYLEKECTFKRGSSATSLLIEPKEKDIGGFMVRRLLPNRQQRSVGPWVFFDHMGPANFRAGTGIDVRPHPHINLATVTYLFEGEILHRDSLGSFQAIQPGDINLMVAGSGIVHSERETESLRSQDHALHGLQLWLALPEEMEEVAPAFYHYPSNDIPHASIENVKVRIMMGNAYGKSSPVKTYADTLYVEAHLKAGQSLRLPEADERAVYVALGCITINAEGGSAVKKAEPLDDKATHETTYEATHEATKVSQWNMAVLETSAATVTAVEDSRIAVIGGESLGKRFMEWNFVSSRKERIEQAKQDWQNGKFAKVVGDEEEFIPYP